MYFLKIQFGGPVWRQNFRKCVKIIKFELNKMYPKYNGNFTKCISLASNCWGHKWGWLELTAK